MAARGKPSRPKAASKGKQSRDPLLLVYIVGTVLTIGFAWVIWPFVGDSLPSQDQQKEALRLLRDNPNAEVLTLPVEKTPPVP